MTLKMLDFVKDMEGMPFSVFQLYVYGRLFFFENIGSGETLTASEKAEWERVVKRFDQTCKKAYDLGVSLLIDAEESWMQDAADALVEEMMMKYNKEEAIIFKNCIFIFVFVVNLTK